VADALTLPSLPPDMWKRSGIWPPPERGLGAVPPQSPAAVTESVAPLRVMMVLVQPSVVMRCVQTPLLQLWADDTAEVCEPAEGDSATAATTSRTATVRIALIVICSQSLVVLLTSHIV
jgi:hypothetical protein